MKKIHNLFCLFFFIGLSPQFSYAQQNGSIAGRITTSDGKPAAFVSIGLKEIAVGQISDENGNYRINRVKPGTYTLKVRAVGLESQENQVTVNPGQTLTLNFTLLESAAKLKEVLVAGNKRNKFAKTESPFVSKMPLTNLENPQVYSVVTKELLNEQLIFTADEAVRNTPGIQKMWEATGRSGDGGSYFSSRGFIMQSQLRNGIAGL
ncbi:MAG: TonB-dependent siderophore receptor, partial [Cytophagales bacterium CG18_big_fil_WC_8_21_14_2_50_42_9]